MRSLMLLAAATGAAALAAGPAAAQTSPVTPRPQLAAPPPPAVASPPAPAPQAPPRVLPAPGTGDDDDVVVVTPPGVPGPRTAQAPTVPDWTFEEVMGGNVTVGKPVSPWAVGIGALAGVVTFNVLQQYAFPGGGFLAQTVLAESEIAASRIYAVGSAVAGALAGQYVYEQTTDAP